MNRDYDSLKHHNHQERNDAERTLKADMLISLGSELKGEISFLQTPVHITKNGKERDATPEEINQSYARALQLLSDIDQIEAFLKSWSPPTPKNMPAVSLEPPPPENWMLDKWLPQGELTILSGMGGLGKSHIALQLACALACGCPDQYLNNQYRHPEEHKPIPAKSMIATWEDAHNTIQNRIHRIAKITNWMDLEKVAENVIFRDMKPQGHIWIPTSKSGHIANRGHMGNPGHDLLHDCEEEKIGFLVLDSIVAIFGQDSNSAPHVRQFLNYISAWCNDTGITALMIGHPSKADQRGVLGSVDWTNGVRAVWDLIVKDKDKPDEKDIEKMENPHYVLRHYKVNNAPKQPDKPLIRETDGIWREAPSAERAVTGYQDYKQHWEPRDETPEPSPQEDTDDDDPYENAFLS